MVVVDHSDDYVCVCLPQIDRYYLEKVNRDVCIPIKIPEDDPFWGSKKRRCLGLTRSIASPGLLCQLEYRQQVLHNYLPMFAHCTSAHTGSYFSDEPTDPLAGSVPNLRHEYRSSRDAEISYRRTYAYRQIGYRAIHLFIKILL